MRATPIAAFFTIGVLALAAGCHSKLIDKQQFRSALDSYYASQQNCLWPSPIKLPAQADTNNQDQTQGFDALVDAGMLRRGSAEKKRFLVGSKQVNNYDLSAQGRSNWTPDASQPGYGNFCFGHPQVTSIDSFNPNAAGAVQYSVNYHYGVSLPDWANTPEMKTAFPSITAQANGAPASATLIRNGDAWQVQNASPAAAATTTGQ